MIIRVSSILLLFIVSVSCATTPRNMPEKYNLDNELEIVDQISPVAGPNWQYVDKQALVLRVNWDDYYLIVLHRPIYGLSSVALGLSPKVPIITGNLEDNQRDLDKLKASVFSNSVGRLNIHSRLTVNVSGIKEYYAIEKIYKFKDLGQKEEFKERLRNF